MARKPTKPAELMPTDLNSIEWLIYNPGTKKILNKDLVRKLAEADISDNKIAEYFGMSVTTLRDNYGFTLGEGKFARELRVKLKELQLIEEGNASVIIAALKTQFGRSEKINHSITVEPTRYDNLSDEELDRLT